ncbi:uncharacterized protein G2W53_037565 [Senna tora]|uniref:Uncharacterized protein n=1 Tax=Senna tora TaxID=362788 RepID=A0A834SKF4_9FABA|nr:uncharacterized protein G2W53_037565 [Senna tora]
MPSEQKVGDEKQEPLTGRAPSHNLCSKTFMRLGSYKKEKA